MDHLKGPFLEAYKDLGTYSAALEKVGTTFNTFDKWRKTDLDFRAAVEEADARFGEKVERIAFQEGLRGSEVPVYYEGKKVDTYYQRDSRVLLKLLEVRNQRYRAAARVKNFNLKVLAIIDSLTTSFVDMLSDRIKPSCPKCHHVLPTRTDVLEGLRAITQHYSQTEVIESSLEDDNEPVSASHRQSKS